MRVQALDFSVDVTKALLWQYNSADKLQSLLNSKQQWYVKNQTEFWSNWHRDVFSLDTANDFGLDVWAIILGLPLVTPLDVSPADYPAWGFSEGSMNFEHGNFAIDAPTYRKITTDARRTLLKIRYFSLITTGSDAEINEFFAGYFGEGKVCVIDNMDMTMSYIFNIPLTIAFKEALKQFDILPRPAGVQYEIVENFRQAFGFKPFEQNFDTGAFAK